MRIQCENQEKSENVFDTDSDEKPFDGTLGDSLTIFSANPGVLSICDIELEIKVIDQKLEDEIDRNLALCKGWHDDCFDLFPGYMNYENRANCLENFGFNKTAEYCTNQLMVVSPDVHYPLRNQYECLSYHGNDFRSTQISDEASQCLNAFYDYNIEECLR